MDWDVTRVARAATAAAVLALTPVPGVAIETAELSPSPLPPARQPAILLLAIDDLSSLCPPHLRGVQRSGGVGQGDRRRAHGRGHGSEPLHRSDSRPAAHFEPYARAFNEQTGTSLSAQQYFDSMTISERTTYYAVTHALLNSPLTDESGADLGRAFDLVDHVERVAARAVRPAAHRQPGPTDSLAERPEVPTPTPPDRPRGAHIERIEDAAQEFLSDWAVRRDVASALDLVSPQLYACVDIDDLPGEDAVTNQRALDELRTIVRYAVDELGRRQGLTAAVDAVAPVDPKLVVVEQPFSGEFTLLKMTAAQAAPYFCGSQAVDPAGEYNGMLFRFKKSGAAILGLLWQRLNGEWRIVAYRAFEQ